MRVKHMPMMYLVGEGYIPVIGYPQGLEKVVEEALVRVCERRGIPLGDVAIGYTKWGMNVSDVKLSFPSIEVMVKPGVLEELGIYAEDFGLEVKREVERILGMGLDEFLRRMFG